MLDTYTRHYTRHMELQFLQYGPPPTILRVLKII